MMITKDDIKAASGIRLVEKTSGHGESDFFISFGDRNGARHYETIKSLLSGDLSALKAALPDTHAIVPKEPTPEMFRKGWAAMPEGDYNQRLGLAKSVWPAMIEAAQTEGPK